MYYRWKFLFASALMSVSPLTFWAQSRLLTNPAQIAQFPSVERVREAMNGTDEVDTHARFMAALWLLNGMIKDELVRAPNGGMYPIPPVAQQVQDRYSGAITHFSIDQVPTAGRDPKFSALEAKYEKDPAFLDSLLTQFFSPEFRTDYYAWIRKPVPPQAAGSGVAPKANAKPNSDATQTPADSLALGRALVGPRVWVAEARKLRAEKNEAAALAKFNAAVEKYKDIIANYPHSRFPAVVKAYEELGSIYHTGLRRYDLALPIWQTLRKLKPDDAETAALVGQALYGLKRNDEALVALNEALGLNPKPNIAAIVHTFIGYIYEDKPAYDKAILSYQEALRIDPSYIYSHYNIGNVYAKMGKKAEAISVYNKLLTINKEEAANLLNAINSPAGRATNNVNKLGATSTISTVPPTAPSRALDHLSKGNQFFNDRDFNKAIAEYQAVIALKPEKKVLLEAYGGLAETYYSLMDLNKAIPNYLQMTIFDPGNSSNFWILGDRYFQSLQYAEAAAAFKEAIRLKPTDRLYYSELGQAYLMLSKKTEAMQVYDSLVKIDRAHAKVLLEYINDPGGTTALLAGRSRVSLLGRDVPAALIYVQAALNIKPANPYGLLEVGESYYLLDRYDDAIAAYRSVIALKPKPETAAEAFSGIGHAYSTQKQYSKAIPEFKQSMLIKPDDYTTRELGHCYFNLKDYPNALAAYRQAVQLKPDNADGHFSMGMTFAAMNEFDKAIAAYVEAARLEPKSGRGYTAIGNIHFQLKNYPDAGRAFGTALRIDPKNKTALFGIGTTYLAVGRKPDAMRAYTALKPLDEKLAQQLLDEINKQ